MKKFIWLILILMLSGCAGSFQAEDTIDVSVGLELGQLQIVETDAGLMYKWFSENNAWTESEQASVAAKYFEMNRLLIKFKEKLIAGSTEYHRLLYFNEDFTEAWIDIRPDLQEVIDIVQPGFTLEDQFAVSAWYKITMGMDGYLQSNNVRLKAAKDGMDAATYAAFKEDAKGMLKLVTPLLKGGIPGL